MFKLLFSILLLISIDYGYGLRCSKENIFGMTVDFSCPTALDKPEDVYCCGFGDNKYCCSDVLSLDDVDLEKVFHFGVKAIVGIVVTIIILVIVVCVVCCCCCPFCLLKNRQQRGGVVKRNDGQESVMQPLQQGPPTNAYPTQPAYPQQQQPYPPQGAPVQPYPPQGPPMQQYPPPPYPAQGQPYPAPVAGMQPYPQAPSGDQPPAYAEKQPPFNPNYQ